MRVVSAVVVFGTIAILLAGCERFDLGPVEISRNGNELAFVSCTSLSATQIYGDAQSSAGVTAFARLSGNLELSPSVELRSSHLPDGMSGTFTSVDFASLRYLSIRTVGPESDLVSGFSDPWHLTVPEGGWLHTDGRVTITPCQ